MFESAQKTLAMYFHKDNLLNEMKRNGSNISFFKWIYQIHEKSFSGGFLKAALLFCGYIRETDLVWSLML